MGWVINKLIKLFIALIILGLMAVAGFVLLANPNNFKPRITQYIQTYTGQPFQINGPIEWTLRPKTTIHLQDVVLAGSDKDKLPAIQIKELSFKVDLISVFKNKPVIFDLSIQNPVINWTQLKMLGKAKNPGKPFTVQAFELKNGSITIQDPTDHLNWLLQNVSFDTDSFMMNAGQPLPSIKMQGQLVNLDRNSTYQIATTLKFDDVKQILNLDPLSLTWNDANLKGSANISQFDTDPIISGDITLAPTDLGAFLKKLDPYFAQYSTPITHTMQMKTAYSFVTKEQILDLTKLNLQIDKGVLSGDVKLGLASPYHAEFAINADHFDFAPLSLLGSAFFPNLRTMGTFPSELVRNFAIKGKFSGTQLSFDNAIAIEHMQMEIANQGGVLQFMPVIINAYGGTHDLSLTIDASKPQPSYVLNDQADKVDLDPWLKIVNQNNPLSGNASMKISIQGTCSDLTTAKQTMAGTLSMFVNNGVYTGFDASKLMNFSAQTVTDIFNQLSTSPAANMNVLAIKMSSNWIQTQADHPKTKFDHLQINAELDKGATKKATIALVNSVVDFKANGSFSFADQSVNFDSTLVSRIDPNTDVKTLAGYMKDTPISMSITGTLNKPVFGPNVQTYVMNILKPTQTDLQTQAINKMLAVTPPNAKTDKTATELFLNSLQSLNK